jgi:shikimate dehydrogenase
MIRFSMDRYAVIGNPIAHSLSPQIHALFAKQTCQDLSYEALLAPLDRFAETVHTFRDLGGKGLNVTLPFKLDAWALANQRSARAERAGAANTLVFLEKNLIFGDNTDGMGLLRDLMDNHAVEIKGCHILILGAGGAVRGILEPLLCAEPMRVVIANRTESKAVELRTQFQDLGSVEACGFEQLLHEQFDLIINATSAGVIGRLPPIPDNLLNPGGCCYDLFYATQPTAFVRWGQSHGAAKALNGLGMLVEQAAESFFLWRGIRPDTRLVIQALNSSI